MDNWQKKVVFENGDWVMLHSPQVMLLFLPIIIGKARLC
jgi:hypothetical protein